LQGALAALHFAVQCVALHVADDPAVQVDLVQVPAAVSFSRSGCRVKIFCSATRRE